jgi:hypothetical protein
MATSTYYSDHEHEHIKSPADSHKDMALDPNFAVQAFTLIASICAAEFITKGLETCARIDGDSKTAVYYSCGIRSTFAAVFAFATAYGMYALYQRHGQTLVTPGINDIESDWSDLGEGLSFR